MRALTFLVSFLVLVAVGFYALRGGAAHHVNLPTPASAADKAAAPAIAAAPIQKATAGHRPEPYRGPAFDPAKKYAAGTYTPRGFPADFRTRVKRDFADLATERLGHPLSEEQAKAAAAVQDAFWDQHGPTVDLFQDRKIPQPEFAERTHTDTIAFTTGMEKVFSDDDYQKLFDVPKGTDAFPLLYHSKDEQPGTAMAKREAGEPRMCRT